MIVCMTTAIKFFLFVIILFIGKYLLQGQLSKKHFSYLCVIIAFFALLANYVSGYLPALTDTIVLTALDEKCEESQGTEVFLNGYTIDGQEFQAGKYLQIESGHWFWNEETYAWRSEKGGGQPSGITREVVLKIPVGYSRSLDFDCNVLRGCVQINDGCDTWFVDTFAEDNLIKNVYISKSATSLLIVNHIRYLLFYSIILFLLSSVTIWILRKFFNNPFVVKKWLGINNGRIIYASISIIIFIFAVYYSNRASFWYDEICQINFTMGNIRDAIKWCLTLKDSTPPLVNVFCTIWYHIAPYGERWLLLPCIFLCACSIYIVGIIAETIFGKYSGILASSILACSTVLWSSVAYEYRAYSFFLFFSSLALYFYIRRNEKFSIKWHAFFSLSLTCLAMTHYFGMIVMAFYFLTDLYLLKSNKIKWQTGLVYLLPGLISFIWLISVQMHLKTSIINSATWQGQPSENAIYSLLHFLTGDNEFCFFILCLGMGCSINLLIQKKESFNWQRFYSLFLFVMMITIIFGVFIYGNLINQESSMWRERYFLFLIANVALLSSMGLTYINSIYKNVSIIRTVCLCLIIYLSLNCFYNFTMIKSSEPFREAADWIYTESNYIFNDDVLIVATSNSVATAGWEAYYINRQGKRDTLNVASQYELSEETILKYNRLYVQYSHTAIQANLQKVLSENYKLETDNKDVKVRVYVHK